MTNGVIHIRNSIPHKLGLRFSQRTSATIWSKHSRTNSKICKQANKKSYQPSKICQLFAYSYDNSNNVAILLPQRALRLRKPHKYRLSLTYKIISTLFRDYYLYYFISILRHFCTVLRQFFAVLFPLSSLVLQNMLQIW